LEEGLGMTVETDNAVQSGRQALDSWWGYPWYDPATDGVRRIELREPYDWSWLRDWLRDWIPEVSFPDSALKWAAWLLLAVLLGAILYHLLRYFHDRLGKARERTAEDGADREPVQIELLPVAPQRFRGDLLAEATRLYEAGDFAQAVLYLFSYELAQLDKNQLIHLGKGKTNRQYLRELPRIAGLRRLLERTMVAFEDVFFGHRPLGRAQFEACWADVPQFEAFLREARP